jgi:hypothetical protein
MSNDSPNFELFAKNKICELKITLSKESDYIYAFESEETQKIRYQFKQLQNVIKIVSSHCEKVTLKINTEGVLCIQSDLKTQQSSCIIEYYLLAENYSVSEESQNFEENIEEEVIDE